MYERMGMGMGVYGAYIHNTYVAANLSRAKTPILQIQK